MLSQQTSTYDKFPLMISTIVAVAISILVLTCAMLPIVAGAQMQSYLGEVGNFTSAQN
jgi:hypothetical protein